MFPTSTPTTNIQWGAINNLGQGTSLTNQLLAGKTQTSTPSVVAASSAVKSPTAPAKAAPAMPTMTTGLVSPGSTTMLGTKVPAVPTPTAAPTGLPISSHTTALPDGSSVTVKYDTKSGVPSTQTQDAPQPTQVSTPDPTPTYAGLVGKSTAIPAASLATGQQAQDIANYYAKQMGNAAQTAGTQAMDYLGTGAPYSVASGSANAATNTGANVEAGLAKAEEAALQGTGLALTGQSQAQAGLLSAAGAIKPETAAVGQTVFNPDTGTYSGEIGGVSAADMNTYASLLATGAGSQVPTSVMGNAALSAQLQQMAKQINPSYNPVTTPAQAAGVAANTTAGVTAPTEAAQSGYQAAVTTYGPALAGYQTVSSQGKTLQDTMMATGINANPQFVNQRINQLQTQLGATQYVSFLSALTETQQAYEKLLGAVGAATPTLNGVAATSLLTPDSTPAQINAALTQLQTAAYNKLKPMHDLISTYQSQIGGVSAPSAGSVTSGGMQFKQDATGVWVPA